MVHYIESSQREKKNIPYLPASAADGDKVESETGVGRN
jgi:hypothetical protein